MTKIIFEFDPANPRAVYNGAKLRLRTKGLLRPDSLVAREQMSRCFDTARWCEKASDRIRIIPRNEWRDIIEAQKEAKASLRNVVWGILDQDGRGSCAQECGGSAVMAVRSFARMPDVWPNQWCSYWRVTNGRDQGSSIASACRAIRDWGCIPQSLCPRSQGFQRQPDEYWEIAKKYRAHEWIQVETRNEFASCLLQNIPVMYGRSGHAICGICMTDAGGSFKAAGSWGNYTDCNDPGFHGEHLDRSVNEGYGMYGILTPVDDGSPIA